MITVVTGLPRSGTSMMMQMLAAGGCPVLTDGVRAADSNNPQGYFEYEPVKRLPIDSSWLPLAQGKAIKVVAALVPYLPLASPDGAPYAYRAIFLRRDWQEVSDSQMRMLRNLGREPLPQPSPRLERGMEQDLARARSWLRQHGVPVLEVDFRQTLAAPAETAARLATLFPAFQQEAAARAVLAGSRGYTAG